MNYEINEFINLPVNPIVLCRNTDNKYRKYLVYTILVLYPLCIDLCKIYYVMPDLLHIIKMHDDFSCYTFYISCNFVIMS